MGLLAWSFGLEKSCPSRKIKLKYSRDTGQHVYEYLGISFELKRNVCTQLNFIVQNLCRAVDRLLFSYEVFHRP